MFRGSSGRREVSVCAAGGIAVESVVATFGVVVGGAASVSESESQSVGPELKLNLNDILAGGGVLWWGGVGCGRGVV